MLLVGSGGQLRLAGPGIQGLSAAALARAASGLRACSRGRLMGDVGGLAGTMSSRLYDPTRADQFSQLARFGNCPLRVGLSRLLDHPGPTCRIGGDLISESHAVTRDSFGA